MFQIIWMLSDEKKINKKEAQAFIGNPKNLRVRKCRLIQLGARPQIHNLPADRV